MPDAQVFGATIVFEPRPTAIEPGHIYLGVAEPGRLETMEGGAALILTHKGRGRGYMSTAAYVTSRTDEEIAEWRQALGIVGAAHAQPLSGLSVVVEDASPDTCLSVVTLARRLRGEVVTAVWIDYVDRWEAGDVHSTGAPEHSFGALLSALVHPFFDAGKPEVSAQALVRGVAYLEALIARDVDPADLPTRLPISLHADAVGRLGLERERYRQAIRSGTVVQLSLPVRGSGRRRTIDAIILSELEPTGTVKAWLRRDASSPSGDGYGLMALHRPREVGTGGDMSVSVDPTLAVHLLDLWCELEAREETAWREAGEVRPRDHVRALNVYADHSDREAQPCNQPWYDGGDLTLLAAPKALGVGGPLGSKLGWRDVLDAVWGVYRPDANVQARPREDEGAAARLLDTAALEARTTKLGATALVMADLVQAEVMGERAVWTETLERALAGCLRGDVPAIDRLAAPDDYDIFHERGGTVLVSNAGVLLYEETPAIGFPAAALAAAAKDHALTLGRAIILEGRLQTAIARALLAVQKGDGAHTRDALTYIYRMQMDARSHLTTAMRASDAPPPPDDPMVIRVSEAMKRRWSAQSRFEAVIARTEELAEMVSSATETRSAGLLRRLTIYGFPALAFGAIIGDAFLPLSDDHAPWKVLGVAGCALGAYLILVGAFTWISDFVVRRTDRAWARDLRRPGLLTDDE
jgi:hypothetical protein